MKITMDSKDLLFRYTNRGTDVKYTLCLVMEIEQYV